MAIHPYSLSNPIKYTDPSGHDAIDALAFLTGVVYGWGHANLVALGPIVPQPAMQQYDALAVDSTAFAAGRTLGGLATIAQGSTEAGAGITAIGGGGLFCTTGVGCVLGGGEAVVAGSAVLVHGTSVAMAGAAEAGQQANILFAQNQKPEKHIIYEGSDGYIGRTKRGLTNREREHLQAGSDRSLSPLDSASSLEEAQFKEQLQIELHGGVENLPNKRNELNPIKFLQLLHKFLSRGE